MVNSQSIKRLSSAEYPKNRKKTTSDIYGVIFHVIKTSIGGKASQKEIAKRLNWKPDRIRYHLNKLAKQKLLLKQRIGRSVFYCLNKSLKEQTLLFENTEKSEVRHLSTRLLKKLQFIYVTYDMTKGEPIKTTYPVNRGRYTSYKYETIFKGLNTRIEYFRTKVRIEFRDYFFDPQLGFMGQVLKDAYAVLTTEVMSRFPDHEFANARVSHTHAPMPSKTAAKILKQNRLDHIDFHLFSIDRTPENELGGNVELTGIEGAETFEELMKLASTNKATITDVLSHMGQMLGQMGQLMGQYQQAMITLQNQNEMIVRLQEEIASLRKQGASNPTNYHI